MLELHLGLCLNLLLAVVSSKGSSLFIKELLIIAVIALGVTIKLALIML